MSGQTFEFFENSGGMNLQDNDIAINPIYAEDICNLHATMNGCWTTQHIGFTRITQTPAESGATITSLYEFTDLTGNNHLIASAGSKLWRINPDTGNWTLLGSGFSNGAPFYFTTMKGLLIGCNGVDAPQKWDGTSSMTPLSGWPAIVSGITPGNPSISAIFANRLVFSGDKSNPSMLYISALENPQNFIPGTGAETAGAIQVSPGDGQKITGLKTLYLPAENQEILVIFKDKSTYLLVGQDAETFTLQKISDEFGSVNANSIVLLGNQLLFMTCEGITSLSTATQQGNMTTGFLSNPIRLQWRLLNRDLLIKSFALHLRDRQEVWWFVTDSSASKNQRVLVMNYSQNSDHGYAWSRRSGIEAASGAMYQGRVLTGGYNGHLYEQLRGNSYDGSPIPWSYRTPYYSLGSTRLRKRIRDMELYLKQIAAQTLSVSMAWDHRRGSGQKELRSLNVQPNASSTIYGTSKFARDSYNVSGTTIFKLIPAGSGRFFQIEFSGEVIDNPIELQGWTLTAQYGGLR